MHKQTRRQVARVLTPCIYGEQKYITGFMQYIVDIMKCIMYNQNTSERRQDYDMKNKKLKLARVEKDMSQEDLANIVGVTRQTIGLIETGNYNPTLKLCIAICNALDKTLNDLFWEEL